MLVSTGNTSHWPTVASSELVSLQGFNRPGPEIGGLAVSHKKGIVKTGLQFHRLLVVLFCCHKSNRWNQVSHTGRSPGGRHGHGMPMSGTGALAPRNQALKVLSLQLPFKARLRNNGRLEKPYEAETVDPGSREKLPPLWGMNDMQKGNVYICTKRDQLAFVPPYTETEIVWPEGTWYLQCERARSGHMILLLDSHKLRPKPPRSWEELAKVRETNYLYPDAHRARLCETYLPACGTMSQSQSHLDAAVQTSPVASSSAVKGTVKLSVSPNACQGAAE